MRKFWRWQKCFISWVWWCLNNDICQNSLNCLVKIDECWYTEGLLWWLSGRESTCQWRRHGFNPWVRKILWRKKWQPTPVFLPGKSHGQRSLVGYSPWGCKESDTTKQLSMHTHKHRPRDHTKWRKSEREREIPYDITYRWNLKCDTNELISETETDSQT